MIKSPIDTFKLPVMLKALRLPSFQKHWQALAEQADKEAWPAARFLAVLAEYEIAERETRRIQRHFNEAKLLLWLPPIMQEVFALFESDRMRSSVRPLCAAFSEAAGRYGDQRIRSISRKRARCSEKLTGFPHPDLFDHFAHSGHRLLTLPLP